MSEFTISRNMNNLSKPNSFISTSLTASGSAEFMLNLFSNASMEPSPGTKLPSLTTFLPTPVTLSGDWQVALLEIFWPALVRNITVGQITVSKIVPRPESSPPHQSPSKNIRSRQSGLSQ